MIAIWTPQSDHNAQGVKTAALAAWDLDYGIYWTVAFISVAISVGFYQIVRLIEVTLLPHYRDLSGV